VKSKNLSNKGRVTAAVVGTTVGFGALVSYNLMHAALADPSAPLPPDTNLDAPVTVEANAGVWAYARSPQLALATSVSPTVVTPGSKITYSYAVSNLSQDTSFTGVTVTDDKCSNIVFKNGDTNNDKQLSVGEVWNYSCSTTILKDQQNNAKVTAKAVVNPASTVTPTPTPSVTPSVTPTPTPSVTQKTVVDGTYLGSLATVTVPGENITYQVQVQAVINGGKITAITMPTHTENDSTSKTILKYSVATTAALNADSANPTMIYEAIAGNTANIATISGATYTTAGFKASLQTALTMAGY
jgi:uncharacterized repeat protein (TIGR01451 family)